MTPTQTERSDRIRNVGAVIVFLCLLGPQAVSQGNAPPKQVLVSVKIIEFQTTKGVETGLSAFFSKNPLPGPFGEAATAGNALNTVDLTFPSSTAAGISVFLDNLKFGDGELEILLQALVEENRAFILSRPRAMVMIGQTVPTVVKTVQAIPYESTVVVGNTAVQVTKFEDTGVTLTITVPEVIDDDGDWSTRDDTFVRMDIQAEVKEEGQRIVVALDDQLAAGSNISEGRNEISVPEFILRSIKTHVWVRDGQVLILGGLYRNTETKNLSTLPWLGQAEDFVSGVAQNIVPGNILASPITSTIGNRSTSEGRRELVFLIRSEIWRPAFTINDDLGFRTPRENAERPAPSDRVDTVGEEKP